MVHILKNSRDETLVSFEHSGAIDKRTGIELKEILVGLLKKHTVIFIDLFGVEEFTAEGYEAISDLYREAVSKKCEIKFTNAHDNICEIADSLTLTIEG